MALSAKAVHPDDAAAVPAIQITAPVSHLPLRVRPAIPMTDDELFEFAAKNSELRIERTAEGELIIMPPTGGETGRRNFNLAGRFWSWVERDGTGVGFDSSTGFILPNGAERSPDVSWVKKERWEALSLEQRRKFPPLCPDFVAEIRSASDSLADALDKLREYMDAGVALGWLFDPEARSVYVFRPGQAPERLEEPRELVGDPVLPGFVLDPSSIW